MGQVPSLGIQECERDKTNFDNLIQKKNLLGWKDPFIWKPYYSVNEGTNYYHVLSMLKTYNNDYEITWSDDNFRENGKCSYKSGIFNGSTLPISGQGAEWGDHDWPDFTWNSYPSTYMFKKRQIQPIQPIQPIQQPIQPIQNSNIYTESPNAPSDNFTDIEWKTQEYKAEVTSTGSYIMFEKTQMLEYNDQAGQWKKIKNMAQDKKISKLDFISYRDRLYDRPFNLPIDHDAHNYAKYKVLYAWIIRDGSKIDRENVKKYPQFYSSTEFNNYSKQENIVDILSDLNSISCNIQSNN